MPFSHQAPVRPWCHRRTFLSQWLSGVRVSHPFCWLVLFPLPQNGVSRLVFPRTLLCTTAVIQTLYAYPVAGSQIVFIRTLLIVVGAICIADFGLWFATKYDFGYRQHRLLRIAGSAALFCLFLGYAHMA